MPHVSKLKWSLTCGKSRSSRPGRRTRTAGGGVISTGKTDNRHCHPVRHNPAWERGSGGTRSAIPVLSGLAEGSGPARLVRDPARGLQKLVECPIHGRAGALAKEERQRDPTRGAGGTGRRIRPETPTRSGEGGRQRREQQRQEQQQQRPHSTRQRTLPRADKSRDSPPQGHVLTQRPFT